MFGMKKKTAGNETENDNVCPYCKRRCTKDHLQCDKGKEYFNIPLGKRRPSSMSSTSSSQSSGHRHHHHHHTSESSHYSSSNIPYYTQQELDTLEMTRSELTYALFCKCRYIFRDAEKYGKIDPNAIFGFLSEEEQDSLNFLLRKCVTGLEHPVETEE